jgi:hypothetical protein
MTLEQTLCQLRERFGKMLPAAPAAVMDAHIDFLRKSGAVDQILKSGAKAPAFTLKNQNGEDVSSVDLLNRGPLVVSFTRGGGAPIARLRVGLSMICTIGISRPALSLSCCRRKARTGRRSRPRTTS